MDEGLIQDDGSSRIGGETIGSKSKTRGWRNPGQNAGSHMKANHSRLLLWSSIGTVAVGAAVAFARRPRRAATRVLACRKIPRHCQGVLLWTERFALEEKGARFYAHDRYYLQATPFRVWSVLDLSAQGVPGESGAGGAGIYHVTHVRVLESHNEEEHLQDRFYGVVSVLDAAGRSCGTNCIARGGILDIKKCFVGGSSNGIESGEAHRSQSPILNYRIDYTSS
jgi:hypothetical protein